MDWVAESWSAVTHQIQALMQPACCSDQGYDRTQWSAGENCDGEVQLSTEQDPFNSPSAQRNLEEGDSFDITFTRRTFSAISAFSSWPVTPRQRDFRDQLELPALHSYPVPPTCTPEDGDDARRHKLLEMYQGFALDLHTGMYLTQLTSNRECSDIHCQLMGDMVTLKLDQNNGRIIEFPLTSVSKVYRIVKNDDKWYTAGAVVPGPDSISTEQIVVVEFMRRKLAFVFKELMVSQRFLICMELLIRRAQQKQDRKAARSLTSAFPPQQVNNRACPAAPQAEASQSEASPGGSRQAYANSAPPRGELRSGALAGGRWAENKDMM